MCVQLDGGCARSCSAGRTNLDCRALCHTSSPDLLISHFFDITYMFLLVLFPFLTNQLQLPRSLQMKQGLERLQNHVSVPFWFVPPPPWTQNRARPRHRGGFLISRNDPASKFCILFWCVFLSRLSIVFQFLSHLVGCCPAKQIGASVQLLSSYTRDEDIANRRGSKI